jgi:hypothetical protein
LQVKQGRTLYQLTTLKPKFFSENYGCQELRLQIKNKPIGERSDKWIGDELHDGFGSEHNTDLDILADKFLDNKTTK